MTSTDNGHLLFYSLYDQKVTKRVQLDPLEKLGRVVSFIASPRHIIVSHKAPAAISIFASHTLIQSPLSPLLDVAPCPYTGHPVLAISKHAGGRMLAYASTRMLGDGQTGIIATQGWKSGSSSDSSGFANSAERSQSPTIGYADTARRLGEGAVSGVGALSRYSYAKYSGYRHQGTPDRSTLSKSAPVSRGYVISRAAEELAEAHGRPQPARNGYPRVLGTVLVIDLVSSDLQLQAKQGTRRERIVAHFRPSMSHPIALLSFSPNGCSILTSSSEAHCFHVFELRPFSTAIDSFRPARSAQDWAADKVWHRYRLNRGFTTAQAISASWSADGRFVAVQTAKGTSHVYAINPQGGAADYTTHGSEQSRNEIRLGPLSVNTEPLARIHPPTSPHSKVAPEPEAEGNSHGQEAVMPHGPAEILFVPRVDVPSSPAHAAHSKSTAGVLKGREVNVLLAYPRTAEIILSTLILGGPGLVASACTLAAPIASRAASTAMSGLSKIMRHQQPRTATLSPTLKQEEIKPALSAVHEQRALWSLILGGRGFIEAARQSVSQTYKPLSGCAHDFVMTMASLTVGHSRISANASNAELLTHSSAIALLPKSIYLSVLFDFHTYPPCLPKEKARDHEAKAFARGQLAVTDLRKLLVGNEVSHLHPGGPTSESKELYTAMHTILDDIERSSQLAYSADAASPPAYPNGYGQTGGRQTWSALSSNLTKSVPIPIKGIQHAARGALAGLRSPKLRPSSSGSTVISAAGEPLSLSFDEKETVHATVPADYRDPKVLLAEEPVHLVSGRQQRRQIVLREPVSASVPAQLALGPHSVVPSSYTPSSLGVIPELSLDGGSSAEDTDKNEDDTCHAQGSSVEEDLVQHADEWEGWKLDGIDDEPSEQAVEDKATASPIAPARATSSNTLSMIAAPSEPVDGMKVNRLLSAVSSADPSPANRDLLGSSPSSLSSNGGGQALSTSSAKKKKQRGKR